MIRRRELLLGAAGAPLVAAGAARAATPGDIATLLTTVLRHEHALALTYGADPFAAHEREHVTVVGEALESVGGRRPAEPQDDGDVDALVGGLPAERRARLLALEDAAIAAHVALMRGTDEANLIRLSSTIVAAAGQHLAVLRADLGMDPIPGDTL